jgi:transketolase
MSGGVWGYGGRNIHFGVREHAMGAVLNGLAAHGGVVPYGATFLIFSDYMRPPIRLAALMKLGVIYVFTHDSIALGEDGPTHQPVEQLAGLRAVPGLTVIRPADANEVSEALRLAISSRTAPVALVLSRQSLPVLDRDVLAPASGLRRGAYVLSEASGPSPDVVLVASGSEVALALSVQERLSAQDVRVRVVSMPSWELFDRQPLEYREDVLPREVPLSVAIEAAGTQGWERYLGERGVAIGVDGFGASAPGDVVLKEYGFDPAQVTARVLALLREAGPNIPGDR